MGLTPENDAEETLADYCAKVNEILRENPVLRVLVSGRNVYWGRYENSRKREIPALRDMAKKLAEGRCTVAEIAKEASVSEASVYNRLREMGVPMADIRKSRRAAQRKQKIAKVLNLLDSGTEADSVCSMLRLRRAEVLEIAKEGGRAVSFRKKESAAASETRALLRKGLSAREIAVQRGVSASAVHAIIARHALGGANSED